MSCRTCSRRCPGPPDRFAATPDWRLSSWAIAVKRVRRHRRAALRRQRALERLCLEEIWPNRDDPEGDVYRHQLGRRLASALDRLPLPQRVAFVLCEVEEMTAGQAAQVAACPEATVRTRLFHARRRLREILADEEAP